MKTDKAIFGCGCFWGIQYIYDQFKGIIKTEVGYMGGDEKRYPNPTYDDVCSDQSGYAEVVQITFNPNLISYSQLLDIFWRSHDPTTMNQQAADFGTQYRSVIFYHSQYQKIEAEKSKNEIQKLIPKPIVTEITKSSIFFSAEENHQKYAKKHGQFACHLPRNPYLK